MLVYYVILFILLSPGVLFTVPPMAKSNTSPLAVFTHALLFFAGAWIIKNYAKSFSLEPFVTSNAEYEEKIQDIFDTIRPYMKDPNEINTLYEKVKAMYKDPADVYAYIYTNIGQPSDRKISALRDRQIKERRSMMNECVSVAKGKHEIYLKLKRELESKPEYKQYEPEKQKVKDAASVDIVSHISNIAVAHAEIDKICFANVEKTIVADKNWNIALNTIL